MVYTVNLSLHSAHTVKPGSPLEQKIQATNAKQVLINGHRHKVCSSPAEARTLQTMLALHGNQT